MPGAAKRTVPRLREQAGSPPALLPKPNVKDQPVGGSRRERTHAHTHTHRHTHTHTHTRARTHTGSPSPRHEGLQTGQAMRPEVIQDIPLGLKSHTHINTHT